MPKCPEYIKSIYNLFDKNTYLIQAHSNKIFYQSQ